MLTVSEQTHVYDDMRPMAGLKTSKATGNILSTKVFALVMTWHGIT
jgi:hypothetical protein